MSAVIPEEEAGSNYDISSSYASHTLPKALSPHSQRKKLLQSPLANPIHQISSPVIGLERSSSPFVKQSEYSPSTTLVSLPASKSYTESSKQAFFSGISTASTMSARERLPNDSKPDMSQLDHIKLYVQNTRPSLSSPVHNKSSLGDPLLRSPLSSPVPWNSESQSKSTTNPILSEIKSNLTGRHTPINSDFKITNLPTYMQSPVSSPIPWKTYEYNQLNSNGYVSVDPKSPIMSRSNQGTFLDRISVSSSQKTSAASINPGTSKSHVSATSASRFSEFNTTTMLPISNVSTLSTTSVASTVMCASKNTQFESNPISLKTSNDQLTSCVTLSSRTPIPSPIPWKTDYDKHSLDKSVVSTNSSIKNITLRQSPAPSDMMRETKSLRTPIPSPIPWTTDDKYSGQNLINTPASISNIIFSESKDIGKGVALKSQAASPIPWKEELISQNSNALSLEVSKKSVPWISEYNQPKSFDGKDNSNTKQYDRYESHKSNNQTKPKLSLNNKSSMAIATEKYISSPLESSTVNVSNKIHKSLIAPKYDNIAMSSGTPSESPIPWMNEINQKNSPKLSQGNEIVIKNHKSCNSTPVSTSLRSPLTSPIPWIANQLPSMSSSLKPILKKINVSASYRSPPTSPLPWTSEAQSRSPIPWSPVSQPKSFVNDNPKIEPKYSKSYDIVSDSNNIEKSKNGRTFSMSPISTASDQTDLEVSLVISPKDITSINDNATIHRNSTCPNTKVSWQSSLTLNTSSPLPWEPNSNVSSPTLLKREINSQSMSLTSNQDTRQCGSPLPWVSYPRSPLLSRSPVPWSSPDTSNNTTQTRPVKSPLPWTFNRIKVENIPDIPINEILIPTTSSDTHKSQSISQKPLESSNVSLNKPVRRNTSVRTSESPYKPKEIRDNKTTFTSPGSNTISGK